MLDKQKKKKTKKIKSNEVHHKIKQKTSIHLLNKKFNESKYFLAKNK